MDDGLVLRVDTSGGVPTLVVDGVLSATSSVEVSRALHKELLDRGRLLVDVSRMRVGWVPALAVFPAVLAAAGGWPAARLVLYGVPTATAELMRTTTASTVGVLLAPDRDGALALLEVRPPRVRRTTALPADPVAAAYARSLVQVACADWALDGLRRRAQAVANELVSNAVQHSSGESVLVLSHDRRGLTVGVQDGSAARPVLPDPDDPDDARFGLRVVERMSDGWGVIRHRRGKTVWALLRDG